MNNNVYVTNTGKLIGCNSGEDEITVFVRNLITHLEDTFKLSVTVEMSDQISAKNRDEIKRLNGMSNCDFCRRKMELLGVIGEDSPRLTMEKLQEFIADSNNNHELLAKVMNYVEYPDLIINQTNYSVIYNGNNVDMPPKELELLYFLASSPNHVFTREQLLDQIWGYEYIGDTRTVDVHIKRLREKLPDHESWRLFTVWGVGYKFEVK